MLMLCALILEKVGIKDVIHLLGHFYKRFLKHKNMTQFFDVFCIVQKLSEVMINILNSTTRIGTNI